MATRDGDGDSQGQGPMERLLPQNVEAEAGVLGALLIDPEAAPRAVGVLTPGDFYHETHQTIFAAITDLVRDGQPTDYLTLTDELARRGQIDDLGGYAYVSSLANGVPTSANVDYYADIVLRTAVARRMIHAAGQLAAIAYNEPDVDALCQTALSLVMRVTDAVPSRKGYRPTRTRTFAEVLDDLATEAETRVNADTPPGVPTGFAGLDAHLFGIEPGELVYLAGRPGSGKSAFGLKLALLAALTCHAQNTGSVDVVTLEMPARSQARRLVAERTEQNTRFIRAGFREHLRDEPDDQAWRRFDDERRWLKERVGTRLHFTEGVVSMAHLATLASRAVRDRGCRLIVVDQLDLFADGASDDEFARITKMSRRLKQIALSAGVAIVCMVQLSRRCEERRNKRPMLSDLRMSGQLEQDADMVWGLYRPAYYEPQREEPDFQQFAELLILKARDGASGVMVPLWFQAEYTRFRDWPADWAIPADTTREVAPSSAPSSAPEKPAPRAPSRAPTSENGTDANAQRANDAEYRGQKQEWWT